MEEKNIEQIQKNNLKVIEKEIKNSQYIANISVLNATDTLILINKNIYKLLRYTNISPLDQEFINQINELKKPYIEAAKKEVDKTKQNLQERNHLADYRLYISKFKKRGIDLIPTEHEIPFEERLQQVQFDQPIAEDNLYQVETIKKLIKK